MEEEQLQEQENQVKKFAEEQAKQAVKKQAEQAKKQMEKAIKEATKKAIMAATKAIVSAIVAVLPYILIAIAIIAVITTVACMFKWLIDRETVVQAAEVMTTNLSSYVRPAANGELFQISNTESSSLFRDMYNKLKDSGLDPDSMWLSEDSPYLKAIIKAELATTYPQLSDKKTDLTGNNEAENDNFQGIVKIIRRSYHADDNDKYTDLYPGPNKEMLLNYINETEFNNKLSALKNNFNDNDYNDLKQYYTIDNSEQSNGIIIKVALFDGENVVEHKVSYQAKVSKYSTPVEFLIAQLQVTNNPEYIYNFVDMIVNNSSIELVLQEEYVKTKTEEWQRYERSDGLWVNMVIDGNEVLTQADDLADTYTTESYSLKTYIRKVDTWIAKGEQKYEKKESTTSSTTEPIIEELGTINGTSVSLSKKTWEVITKDSTTYTALPMTIEGNESKFLGLWRNNVGEYVPYYDEHGRVNENALYNPVGIEVKHGYRYPASAMLTAPEWFFTLLNMSERTQSHLNVMKYLLYKYTGHDYGVTEFDFSVFNIEDFNSVGGKRTGNAYLTYLKIWESTTVDENGNYLIHDDGRSIPTIGFGIALMYSVEAFERQGVYGVDAWEIGKTCADYGVSNDIIDAVNLEKIEGFRQTVVSNTAACSPPLTKQQIDALSAVSYQYGGIGNFVEMYNQYGNTDTLKDVVHQTGPWKYYFKQNPSDGRAESIWKLFHEGIYTDKQGNEIIGGGTFLDNVDMICEYIKENKYGYCMLGNERDKSHGGIGGSHRINTTFEDSKDDSHLLCCATLVSWAMYESGYTEFQGVNGCAELARLLRSLNAEEIRDYSQLQPGDICFQGTSHVQVYAGDGKWYNAGGNSAIRNDPKQYRWNSFEFALRLP